MVIFAEVSFNQSFNFFVLDILVIFHKFAYWAIVNVVTHALFGFNFVTVCYGYIVHLVAETQDKHILRISPSSTYSHPNSNLAECFFVFPVAYNHLAANTHTSADMTELTVAMCALVKVHEVHVHSVPRNFLVELSMQVQQRFLQLLKAVNPHLGWRECVHPCDNTDTFFIIVCCLEYCFYFF